MDRWLPAGEIDWSRLKILALRPVTKGLSRLPSAGPKVAIGPHSRRFRPPRPIWRGSPSFRALTGRFTALFSHRSRLDYVVKEGGGFKRDHGVDLIAERDNKRVLI